MHLSIYQKYASQFLAFSQSTIYGLLIKNEIFLLGQFFMTPQREGVKR